MALQPLPGLGLPQKLPPFVPNICNAAHTTSPLSCYIYLRRAILQTFSRRSVTQKARIEIQHISYGI